MAWKDSRSVDGFLRMQQYFELAEQVTAISGIDSELLMLLTLHSPQRAVQLSEAAVSLASNMGIFQACRLTCNRALESACQRSCGGNRRSFKSIVRVGKCRASKNYAGGQNVCSRATGFRDWGADNQIPCSTGLVGRCSVGCTYKHQPSIDGKVRHEGKNRGAASLVRSTTQALCLQLWPVAGEYVHWPTFSTLNYLATMAEV